MMFPFGKKKSRPLYVISDMASGGARGLLSYGPVIFIEAITRLSWSKLVNMHSGRSAGGANSGIFSIPKTKGSNESRYSAIDGEEGYKKILQYALPKRYGRVLWRGAGRLLRVVHEGRKNLTSAICLGLDKYLTLTVNAMDRKFHKLLKDGSPKLRQVDFFTRLNGKKIKMFDDAVENLIAWLIDKSRYDSKLLHRCVDAAFRFEDTGEPVMLEDTVNSYVVTSWNLTRKQPGVFSHIRTEEGKSIYVSDQGTKLSDITAASCAAPYYFDYHSIDYEGANGEIEREWYTDVGLGDSAISPLFALQRVWGEEDRDYKIIIMGTGRDDKKFETKMMEGIRYGAVDVQQLFREARDISAMKQSLGSENVVEIDLPISLETFSKLYGGDKKLMRAASILGFDLTERDNTIPWKKMPSDDKFLTTPRTIEQLSEAKWDNVWQNMDQVVDLAKWLLNNSAAQGRISEEFAKQAISDINWLYPPEGHDSSEYPEPKIPFPNIRKAEPSIIIERGPSLSEKGWLAGLFKRKTDLPIIIRKRTANDNAPVGNAVAAQSSPHRRKSDRSPN